MRRRKTLGDACLGELVDMEGDLTIELLIAGTTAEGGFPNHELCLLARGGEDETDCLGEAIPVSLLFSELPPALRG